MFLPAGTIDLALQTHIDGDGAVTIFAAGPVIVVCFLRADTVLRHFREPRQLFFARYAGALFAG
jgi:hypothetical protein